MHPPSSASLHKRKRLSGDAAAAPTSSAAAGPAVPPSKKAKKSSDPGSSQAESSNPSSGTAPVNAAGAESATAAEIAAWFSQEPPKKGKHGAAHGQVGHFGKHESKTMEKFKKDFCRTHDIDDELFNQMVQHSDRDKEPFPCDTVEKKDMWKHIYEALPTRDRRSIYRFMRRHFGSSSQRPHDWTPAQDKELIRLYQEFGPKWTAIAKLIERTDDDVSQRWKNQLQHQSTMNRGPWSEPEVQELQRTLQDVWNAKQASGQLEGLGRDIYEMDDTIIPWGQVSDRLNHCRSRQQCGDKWRKVRRRVSSLRENGKPDAIYDLSAETRYRNWSEARGSDPKDLLRRYKSSKYVHSDDEESGPDPRPQLKAQMEERMKTMLAKKSEGGKPEKKKKPEAQNPAPQQAEAETPKAQKLEARKPVNKKITSVFSDSEGESGSGSDEGSDSDGDSEDDGESREDSRSTTNNRDGNGIVKVEPRTSTTTTASTSDGSGSDSGSDSNGDSDGESGSDSDSGSESNPDHRQSQDLAGSQRIKRERSSSNSLTGRMDVDAPGELDGSADPGVKQEQSSANNSDSDEEESDSDEE
ncbi:hypothetical protein P168DRAFT_326438 [Aspergillus campestris IBT 28561]|uniref:Uncharacterized protein n=1 Tax=Aspergillus campestris (strain IBT 28561) TaxID=1392248 RepID=A0A2I1D437_ASPC2|nr:uncharacterized protein P168DRAFT_326438 [Aspergillus campestris IBT 28561]PKY04618.1 hypothetical protein P168DRAFT_326438 [Aspergillus campestris IBT 28561]